jgi:hypothetical protein
MPEILNYGGGKQTAAMCVLVARGLLPRPDAIIAADTGREMPTTWQYLDEHIRPMLDAIGLQVHVAPHNLATVDTHAHNGDLLLPVFTKTGKMQTYCSTEWKARVVNRYARRVLGLEGAIVNWIGFSIDERKRVKGEDGRRFPLIDLMLSRADCERIISDAGLPLPHKSRCWMCPHQTNAEWREVKSDPALWAQAVALDNEIRDTDERGGVWLHRSLIPLEQAPIEGESGRDVGQQCGLGLCFV